MLALDGIRVVDFTCFLAGPFCTMILADMGAEVIKIERPQTGDGARAYGPFIHEESLYFISVNRGKKSIELNLKNDRAKDFLLKLIDTADVVVENFRPGVMNRLGLSYDVLSARNPRLIYASCSGYGHSGSSAQKPAYDPIIQGLTGLMSINGPDSDHPYRAGVSIADIDTGIYAALGITTALYQREKTGHGQFIDIAMFDCTMAIMENAAARYLNTGIMPKAMGNRHDAACPFGTVRASDGSFNIAAGNDTLFIRLCKAFDIPQTATDPRFRTNDLRLQNRTALEQILNDAASTKTIAECCRLLDAAGVPAGPINNVGTALQSPQIADRNLVTEFHHPTAGDIKCIASPLKMSDSTRTEYAPSPVLGADSADYVAEILGISPEEARQIIQTRAFQ